MCAVVSACALVVLSTVTSTTNADVHGWGAYTFFVAHLVYVIIVTFVLSYAYVRAGETLFCLCSAIYIYILYIIYIYIIYIYVYHVYIYICICYDTPNASQKLKQAPHTNMMIMTHNKRITKDKKVSHLLSHTRSLAHECNNTDAYQTHTHTHTHTHKRYEYIYTRTAYAYIYSAHKKKCMSINTHAKCMSTRTYVHMSIKNTQKNTHTHMSI
jgi:hypothetical protein